MLPWQYPIGFLCPKCNNTGYKPSGKSCKDCWTRFGPRNNVQYIKPTLVQSQNSGLRIPFTNTRIDDGFNLRQDQGALAIYQAPPVPIQQQQPVIPPAEPPSYDTYQTVPQGRPQQYQQPIFQPVYQQPMYQAPLPPRVVQPGDPSIGGILCGRCRGKGYTGGGFLNDYESCRICGGTGRVFC